MRASHVTSWITRCCPTAPFACVCVYSREALTILAQKRDDPTQGIFVFFPEEEKVGIKPIRKYCDKMGEEHVTRAILVVQDAMTSHAKQALKETITLGLTMEHFQVCARRAPPHVCRAHASTSRRARCHPRLRVVRARSFLCDALTRSSVPVCRAHPLRPASPPRSLCVRRRSCSSTSPSTSSCPGTW